jgi:DHA1 family inner membrane transport protein
MCGWGLLVPQQHRLISLSPGSAPLLLGLNSAALYVGVSASGVVGAAGISFLDRYQLGLIGAALLMVALGLAWQVERLGLSLISLGNPADVPSRSKLNAKT